MSFSPSRRHFLAALCATPALARQEPTFSADVRVVNILANVLDKHGAIIADLNQSDFQVFEDRAPQTIRYFSRQTDLPLTLGLMVDTSMSQAHVLDAERSASFRFLDQVLRQKQDKVFIMQFDVAVLTRQELTFFYGELNEALASVNTPTRHELMAGGERGTLLYDALAKASRDVMQPLTGRKALIVLTDGEDNGSDLTLNDSIDAAQRADTLVFSIYFSESPSGFGRRILEHLSTQTGGGFFEMTKKRSVDDIYATIENELRNQYNIGYVSDQPVTIGEFRKLQVKTSQKGLTVQARDRYWAKP